MLLHVTISCVKVLQGDSPHIQVSKVTTQNAAKHSSGGYFFCSDSIATTKVVNVTILLQIIYAFPIHNYALDDFTLLHKKDDSKYD